MRALVTGGLGFIGSHLADRLVEDGHQVTIIDKHPTRDYGTSAEVIRMPMQDAEHPFVDIVYHLAGPVGPVGVIGQAGWMTEDIIEMVGWLRPYIDRGVRIVFVSTSEIYGEQVQPMDETCSRIIAAGHSARMEYATAKLAAETMLLNMTNDVTIIRPFNVAGPRQRSEGGFVLPRFIEQARDGRPLTVYQPGTQRRAFTHVTDIVDGIILAGVDGMGAYNLGNPDNACTILELAEDVIELTGSPSRIEVVDPQDLWGLEFREAPDKVPDITKARRDLGWDPMRDRVQTIADAWLQS